MKKMLLGFTALFLILNFSGLAVAVPYTGADIELLGKEYSSTTGTWMDGTETGSIYTAWASQSVTYSTALTAGTWNIGLNVINHGDLGDGWYLEFRVIADGYDIFEGLQIAASDTEVNNGYFTQIIVQDSDTYSIEYTWWNDQYAPSQGLDANIQINSAFFDDIKTLGGNDGAAPVPEPATMLLLGTGLVGLAGVSRKKIFKKN